MSVHGTIKEVQLCGMFASMHVNNQVLKIQKKKKKAEIIQRIYKIQKKKKKKDVPCA